MSRCVFKLTLVFFLGFLSCGDGKGSEAYSTVSVVKEAVASPPDTPFPDKAASTDLLAGEEKMAPPADTPDTETPAPDLSDSDAPVQEPLKPGQSLTWKEVLSLDGHHSTSIGSVSAEDGRLEGGIRFPTRGPGFVLNPARPNRNGRFATVEVVQAMVRAARLVQRKFPPAKLRVHDFSLLKGGKIPHHGSHRNGRDVDILFYLLDKDGKPVPGKGIFIDREGRGVDFGDLSDPSDDVDYTLDVERTYRFLEALVRDKKAKLQRVFVAEHIRSLLMDYAVKAKRPRRTRILVGHVTCQPYTPHDDHIHLRFFCTPEDTQKGCTEMHPVYPWQKSYLNKFGVKPVLSIPKRYTKKTGKKKPYQLRPLPANADKRMQSFWKKRAEWVQKPRTGRSYCR